MNKVYKVLRDCFVESHLFRKDELVKLSEDFPKYEKNFKLVEGEDVEEQPKEPEYKTLATEGSKVPVSDTNIAKVPMEQRELYVSDKPKVARKKAKK